MDKLIFFAIPLFIVSIITERVLSARRGREDIYRDGRDTAASLSMGIGNVLLAVPGKALAVAVWFAAYEYRLFDWNFAAFPALWLLLILAEDCCYYWYHRAGHRVRVFWAAHVNHHSSQEYNLSTALRQTWPGVFYSFVFWIPLALLGVHPLYILTAQAISLIYQFWIHTQLIDRMPAWFEAVFNTPSHHRVHHGSNPQYLDKNYAGILIIWDRMFGTFEPEREPVVYGLTKNIHTYNPLRIAFHAWAEMLVDMFRAGSWRQKLLIPVLEPVWYEEQKNELPDTAGAAQRSS